MGGIGGAHNQSGTKGDARLVGKRGLTKGRWSRSVKQGELHALRCELTYDTDLVPNSDAVWDALHKV